MSRLVTWSWRGLTIKEARQMAAAVAAVGGFVATQGPFLRRVKRAPQNVHQLKGDQDVVIDAGQGDLVMCVPTGHGLTYAGYPLPSTLVAELQPLLAAKGYPVMP